MGGTRKQKGGDIVDRYLLTWKNEAGILEKEIVSGVKELVDLVWSLTVENCYSFEVYHVLPNE